MKVPPKQRVFADDGSDCDEAEPFFSFFREYKRITKAQQHTDYIQTVVSVGSC